MYGWELPDHCVDERFTILEIPYSSWVVITTRIDGDRAGISRCYNDLYVNWFPSSEYEQAPGRPIIEKYYEDYAELWVPITKNNK